MTKDIIRITTKMDTGFEDYENIKRAIIEHRKCYPICIFAKWNEYKKVYELEITLEFEY